MAHSGYAKVIGKDWITICVDSQHRTHYRYIKYPTDRSDNFMKNF